MAASQADLAALLRLDRAELHAHAERYYKAGGATEPEVALVRHGGARVILKDYARTPGWFGRVLAPMLIWREATALARLRGLIGIPRLYRRLDSRALVMEYLPAQPWPKAPVPDIAYARLGRLIAAMHARGVAHCDLRAPSNLLIDAHGTPYIVDFVARVCRGRVWNLPWNWLYRQFERADDDALAKLRVRYAPALATTEDRARLAHRGPLERTARRIGERVRDLVRHFVRRS